MKTRECGEALRDLLADLPAGHEQPLLHLLSCPDCRDLAVARLGERPEEAQGPDYGAVWSRLEADVPRLVEEAGRHYAAAEALLADLLAQPPEQQRKVLREQRFHAPFVLELLLDRSQAAQPRDPESAARLAAHGVALGARLYGREPESEEGALLLAKAECLAGNARRLVGKWAEADVRFDRAARCLARVGGLSGEAAAFCRFLGLLRWEEGLLEEGEALLRQGAREFRELEVSQEEAVSRLLLGMLMMERDRPERAVRLLQAGRAVLDSEARPWLSARAGLSAALGLAQLGRKEPAAAVLAEGWRNDADAVDEREQVRLSWIEGRLRDRLGQRDTAEQLLDDARRKFLSEYSLPEAVLCTLDLGALRAEGWRCAEFSSLLPDLESTFSAEPALDVIRRVARKLTKTLAAGAGPRCACHEAAVILRSQFRLFGYRVDGLQFA